MPPQTGKQCTYCEKLFQQHMPFNYFQQLVLDGEATTLQPCSLHSHSSISQDSLPNQGTNKSCTQSKLAKLCIHHAKPQAIGEDREITFEWIQRQYWTMTGKCMFSPGVCGCLQKQACHDYEEAPSQQAERAKQQVRRAELDLRRGSGAGRKQAWRASHMRSQEG